MSRYIDADSFEANMQNEWERNEISNGEWIHFREMINDEPTADVVPVRKGKWLPYKYSMPGYEYKFHVCSACGCCDEYVSDVPRPNGTIVRIESVRNYCPNCGAKMEGEQDDND